MRLAASALLVLLGLSHAAGAARVAGTGPGARCGAAARVAFGWGPARAGRGRLRLARRFSSANACGEIPTASERAGGGSRGRAAAPIAAPALRARSAPLQPRRCRAQRAPAHSTAAGGAPQQQAAPEAGAGGRESARLGAGQRRAATAAATEAAAHPSRKLPPSDAPLMTLKPLPPPPPRLPPQPGTAPAAPRAPTR